MKIRAGYEISYDCPQPTPMILTLSVHPTRFPDLLTWDHMRPIGQAAGGSCWTFRRRSTAGRCSAARAVLSWRPA
jgi:hypothetical protein